MLRSVALYQVLLICTQVLLGAPSCLYSGVVTLGKCNHIAVTYWIENTHRYGATSTLLHQALAKNKEHELKNHVRTESFTINGAALQKALSIKSICQ